MEADNRPIDPLLLAWKIRDIKNFEWPEIQAQIEARPELLELLWFIAWVSDPKNCPGGLAKFASNVVEENRSLIGTPAMLKAGTPARYTLQQAAEIQGELPTSLRNFAYGNLDIRDLVTSRMSSSWREISKEESAAEFARETSPKKFQNEAVEEAKANLARYLRDLCERPDVHFGPSSAHRSNGAPWFWRNVGEDLLAWLDQRAEKIMRQIADTRVSRVVLKWVKRARQCNAPVWLTGSCRFGKTESVRTISQARPGLYRAVETPDDASMLSLCRAIAEALGIDCMGLSTLRLRGKIGEVLDASGIMLIFDESHMLLPTKITRNTRPQRLDFIRRAIIDRGLPAVFVSTPQSYLEARRKFEKVTGYTMGQWDGRLLREEPVELPEEISEEEKLAVARIHMPGFDDDYLKYVVKRVSAVRGSSVYAQIAKVARMAFVIALESKRKRPTLADIKEASEEVLPTLPAEEPKVPESIPVKPRRGATDFFPDRAIKPAGEPQLDRSRIASEIPASELAASEHGG